jgi:hypothetical protein
MTNIHGTGAGSVTEWLPGRPKPIYLLDCKARQAKDPTDRMRIDLTKQMVAAVLIEGNDAVVPYLRRQMTEVMA